LRSKKDVLALRKGLADGTLDAIVSDHRPEDTENKVLEFDFAAFGMLGLETAYSLANTYAGLTSLQLVSKLSIQPRTLLGLEVPSIKEGQKANLTFFNPDQEWTFEEKDIQSKSKNTPFVGHKFKGKALGICNNGKLVTV
jgi:dihydroorotase